MQTRRTFLATTGATITLLPFAARADGHGGDVFSAPNGDITIHPIDHASFVIDAPDRVIYVDPIGGAEQYSGLPPARTILITHEHGDHYDPDTIRGLMGEGTTLVTNQELFDFLPDDLKARATGMANNTLAQYSEVVIYAIPAYNTTAGRENFHPKGRDNGYVLDFDGFRIYVSGDTEDIPEMRALENIDLAFVCMNLPFTMDAEAAASAVAEFAPKYVYPYHYRGRDNGTQDPQEFADMLPDGIETKFGDWYA